MSVEIDTVIIGGVSSLVGGLAFIAAQRANTSTRRLEQSKIDSEAFQRAQDIYDHAIDQLKAQNDACEKRLRALEIVVRTLRGE